MKTTFIILIVLLTATFANAEGLNSNASYIKKNYPTEYEQTLKRYALAEWKDDFSMVVYEINKQADALVKLVDEFKSDNTNVAFKAIQEWSRDGYKSKNISLFNEMKTFGLKDLLKLHCDWSMVKYEYDKQVKAKNSF
ncbi:MAG: hypothetical protein HOI54_00115 [Candidatus Marinimicrobia bacterium]|jgi:hypothetical protein|nr:hypothetical protein [Candidatus Neomarinimicrobiota bacterium]MBT7141788.1 hypothetical protein [Bacteroidota bacterium]MBT7901670.1 hypothetical protein [Candidatus Neomarinimicrobiota bacterium]